MPSMRVGGSARFDFLLTSRSWRRAALESAALALLASVLLRGRELSVIWPALLAAVFWFVLRAPWMGARPRLGSWAPARSTGRADQDASLERPHSWLLSQRVQAVAPAADLSALSDREPAESPAHAALDSAASLTTRVIYQVGAVSWCADEDVLTATTLTQLRELCAELRRTSMPGCRVIRVASGSNSRYAKSQVAAQLAWLLTERPSTRVLLMEADVDAPALHRMIKVSVPRAMGLSEQLHNLANDARFDTITIMRLAAGFHALIEGRSESPGWFDSPEFSTVLAQQKGEHDVIVLDGPVIDSWPDVQRLQHAVDAVVLVVASGTRLPEALKLAESHFDKELLLKVIRTGRLH
jgi:Mrp family chromosome partitioning ATPase